MKLWLMSLALIACACPSKPSTSSGATGGSGSATGAVTPTSAATCADVKAKVEALYRAEAQQKEPKRVEAAVSDNTTMVMNDCNKDAKVLACLNKATSVAAIEKDCLIPLDDDGTEGEHK